MKPEWAGCRSQNWTPNKMGSEISNVLHNDSILLLSRLAMSDTTGPANSYEQARLDIIASNDAKLVEIATGGRVTCRFAITRAAASPEEACRPPAVPSERTLRSANAPSLPAAMPPKNAAPSSPSPSTSAGTPAAQSPATPKAEGWTPVLSRIGMTPDKAVAIKRSLREISVSPGQLQRGEVTAEALVSHGQVQFGRAVKLVNTLRPPAAEAAPAPSMVTPATAPAPAKAGAPSSAAGRWPAQH